MWVLPKVSKQLKPYFCMTDFCSVVSRCNTSKKCLAE
jgi:hypothetical protein